MRAKAPKGAALAYCYCLRESVISPFVEQARFGRDLEELRSDPLRDGRAAKVSCFRGLYSRTPPLAL